MKARKRTSAGLLMYRFRNGRLEVFLAHPGGPFFHRKDNGHWTIPKGETEPGEELLGTAVREFREEVGISASGPYVELGWIQQKGGKIVHAWAFEGDRDDDAPHTCNTYKMEWPPSSGSFQDYPEVDRVGFFAMREARQKLKAAQCEFLDRLEEHLRLAKIK